MHLSVKKIIEICAGTLICGDEQIVCQTFTKDTRTIKKNDTYIGIKGANFDGNAFYQEAFLKGANCVILEKSFIENNNIEKIDKPIIMVDDSIIALKQLALYVRNNSSAKFLGVTGSVGKTSTRDMIYNVLKQEYKTLKTEGNFNNNIGLPLTLLRLKDEEAAVIEMGMNHLGEIDYLTKITRPHISVITNVGTAHIGQLKSRENILKAKLEICNGMDSAGILIINNDNDMLQKYYQDNKNKHKIITIGIHNQADFMATDLVLKENNSIFKIKYQNKEYSIFCPIPGEVFIYNSLVAFAVGILLKMNVDKIITGIKTVNLTKNRLEIINKDNFTIINDAYNASVDSMKSSLSILKNRQEKRKIAVLGDMLELGDYAQELHEEVGISVVKNNIDLLITVGKNAKYIASKAFELGMKKECIYTYDKNEEVINCLRKIINDNDVILFKASNGMHLKDIIDTI